MYPRLLGRCLIFFFSSRRRHTRLTCDWSSDVCSSDLTDNRCDVWLCGSGRAAKDGQLAKLLARLIRIAVANRRMHAVAGCVEVDGCEPETALRRPLHQAQALDLCQRHP